MDILNDIVVIGGGNSGIQESLYLTRFVRSIKLVEFMDHLNAEKILQKQNFQKMLHLFLGTTKAMKTTKSQKMQTS